DADHRAECTPQAADLLPDDRSGPDGSHSPGLGRPASGGDAMIRLFAEPRPRARRDGVILLAVLIVTAILILVGYAFYNVMSAEHEAAYASARLAQLRMV